LELVLAIPVYSRVVRREAPSAGQELQVTAAQPLASPWLSRLPRRLLHASNRRWVIQGGLDLLAVAFIVMAFGQLSPFSAELLFHGVFVTLVLHAFLFGLRPTLIRIGLVSIPLVVYAEAKLFGLSEPPLELTEWPLMFVIAGLVAWMADRRASTSQRYATLFRNASERLLTVEEDERRRVARELHDGVGQVLTALTLTLDAAANDRDGAGARQKIAAARSLADTALADTRELSHRMRPARIEERGLVTALRDLAAQSGFPVAVRSDLNGAGQRLGSTATVELYRISQEALANAARHSGAEGAFVALWEGDGRVWVEVSDHGHGFDPSDIPESGIGLAGMRERARLIGGDLSVRTGPAGTTIIVSVPAPG
jgi:signal transduction histidine kinase